MVAVVHGSVYLLSHMGAGCVHCDSVLRLPRVQTLATKHCADGEMHVHVYVYHGVGRKDCTKLVSAAGFLYTNPGSGI